VAWIGASVIVGLLVLSGVYRWWDTSSKPMAAIAAPDYYDWKEETIKPGSPFAITIPMGSRVQAGPETPHEFWSMKGTNLILTLSAEVETVAKYRVYVCTALTPCAEKRHELSKSTPTKEVLLSTPVAPPMPLTPALPEIP
jgi:hypothetical protein